MYGTMAPRRLGGRRKNSDVVEQTEAWLVGVLEEVSLAAVSLYREHVIDVDLDLVCSTREVYASTYVRVCSLGSTSPTSVTRPKKSTIFVC